MSSAVMSRALINRLVPANINAIMNQFIEIPFKSEKDMTAAISCIIEAVDGRSDFVLLFTQFLDLFYTRSESQPRIQKMLVKCLNEDPRVVSPPISKRNRVMLTTELAIAGLLRLDLSSFILQFLRVRNDEEALITAARILKRLEEISRLGCTSKKQSQSDSKVVTPTPPPPPLPPPRVCPPPPSSPLPPPKDHFSSTASSRQINHQEVAYNHSMPLNSFKGIGRSCSGSSFYKGSKQIPSTSIFNTATSTYEKMYDLRDNQIRRFIDLSQVYDAICSLIKAGQTEQKISFRTRMELETVVAVAATTNDTTKSSHIRLFPLRFDENDLFKASINVDVGLVGSGTLEAKADAAVCESLFTPQVSTCTRRWNKVWSNSTLHFSDDDVCAERIGSESCYPAIFSEIKGEKDEFKVLLEKADGKLNCISFGVATTDEKNVPTLRNEGSDSVGRAANTFGLIDDRSSSSPLGVYANESQQGCMDTPSGLKRDNRPRLAEFRKLKVGDVMTAAIDLEAYTLKVSLCNSNSNNNNDRDRDRDKDKDGDSDSDSDSDGELFTYTISLPRGEKYCFAMTLANDHKVRILQDDQHYGEGDEKKVVRREVVSESMLVPVPSHLTEGIQKQAYSFSSRSTSSTSSATSKPIEYTDRYIFSNNSHQNPKESALENSLRELGVTGNVATISKELSKRCSTVQRAITLYFDEPETFAPFVEGTIMSNTSGSNTIGSRSVSVSVESSSLCKLEGDNSVSEGHSEIDACLTNDNSTTSVPISVADAFSKAGTEEIMEVEGELEGEEASQHTALSLSSSMTVKVGETTLTLEINNRAVDSDDDSEDSGDDVDDGRVITTNSTSTTTTFDSTSTNSHSATINGDISDSWVDLNEGLSLRPVPVAVEDITEREAVSEAYDDNHLRSDATHQDNCNTSTDTDGEDDRGKGDTDNHEGDNGGDCPTDTSLTTGLTLSENYCRDEDSMSERGLMLMLQGILHDMRGIPGLLSHQEEIESYASNSASSPSFSSSSSPPSSPPLSSSTSSPPLSSSTSAATLVASSNSDPPEQDSRRGSESAPYYTVIAKNLDGTFFDEEQIRLTFSVFGDIVHLELLQDAIDDCNDSSNGNINKLVAKVSFTSKESVTACCKALDNKRFNRYKIKVSQSYPEVTV